MSLTYATYVTTLANLLAEDETNTDFVQILPSVIDYAEGRCYRDLDLLSTVVVDTSTTLTSNTRDFTLPTPAQGDYDIIDQINILEDSVRTPLTPVSRDVLDFIWPTATSTSASQRPQVFAMTTNTTVTVGPPSGESITLETIGRVKPTPLSDSNTTTFLTTQLPDLFLAASMIFASGWQKNFGSQADNPAQAVSWEGQYMKLLASADQYSSRQEFAAASWTSKRPEPLAVPQRG